MATFFLIVLFLIIIWMFFGERIKAWSRRRLMEKMEDAIRSQMGMPSTKEERKRRRDTEKRTQRKRNTWQHTPHQQSNQSAGNVIIPREYAEDVEFVEYKEYSEKATIIDKEDTASGKRTSKIVAESQVSDVEYVEIKSH